MSNAENISGFVITNEKKLFTIFITKGKSINLWLLKKKNYFVFLEGVKNGKSTTNFICWVSLNIEHIRVLFNDKNDLDLFFVSDIWLEYNAKGG